MTGVTSYILHAVRTVAMVPNVANLLNVASQAVLTFFSFSPLYNLLAVAVSLLTENRSFFIETLSPREAPSLNRSCKTTVS